MYRYNKRTLLRRCGISYREIFRRCKYTNIFVAVQIIGHFFAYIIINGKSPRSSRTARRGDEDYSAASEREVYGSL